MTDVLQILAWPGAVCLLVIVALLIFKKPISEAIGRARAVSIGEHRGVDLSGAGPQAQIEAQKEAHKEAPNPLPAPQPQPGVPALPLPSPLYAPIEEELRRRVEIAFPGAQDTQMAWALRMAAQTTVERNHEQIYRIIFGSQIFVLKEINVRGALTVGDAKRVYQVATQNFPEIYENYPFEAWGSYVIDQGLAALDSEHVADDTRIILTPAGKDFLFFLTGRGLPENKVG